VIHANVWKDKIVLKWDGPVPSHIPKNAIHHESDLLFFWEHIRDHARWNDKFAGYLMNLSTQNVNRIHKQFGPIQIKGLSYELQAQDTFFKKMTEMAMKVKNLPIENLPQYEYKLPPLGEFQHRGVVFLVNTRRAPLFADCGCLAGGSIIRTNRDGVISTITIEKLFNNFRDIKSMRRIKVRCFKETDMCFQDVLDVIESGIKQVFLLNLADGKNLKATKDHEILTRDGWVQLGELTLSHEVMTDRLTTKPAYSRVVSVEYVGKEMTYDIKCKAPHHNFVANGIVVHNCGKTYMVAVSTEQKIKKGLLKPGQTLVCGKLATLRSGWLEDTEKFSNLKAVNLWLPQSPNRKEKLLERLNEPADIYIINHDGLRIMEEALAAKKFKKVVVDESTILKGFHGEHKAIKGGQFGRALMNVAAHAEYRVIMSGTPAPNGIEDLWGQFYFLDPEGVMLEPNFNDFKAEFMQVVDMRSKEARLKTLDDGTKIPRPLGPRDPRIWKPKTGAEERVGSIINPLAYRVKLRDHIKDFPDLTVMKREIDMTSEQLRHYKTMEKELKVIINDTRIAVPIKLTQIMKLRQITGGYVIDTEEKVHSIDPNPKLQALDELLEELGSAKVVIYAQYRHEIEEIENRYKKHGIVSVYGGNSAVKNLENIDKFRKNEDIQYIVLHPKSAAHGVTFTIAHYMVFYSIDYSAEDNYQCIKRIDRAGQKHPMFVYFLLCDKSIDQVVYKAIIEKNKNQEKLLAQQDVDNEILRRIQHDTD
jgi:hypothetical protein